MQPASIDDTLAQLVAQRYFTSRELATALYLALRMERPLFVEGEPGVGKTELAKAAAGMLGTSILRLQCYEGLDTASALYEWDYPWQIMALCLAEAAGERPDNDTLYRGEFLLKRPLLQALSPDEQHPGARRVLLIDEIDRADEPFEAFLLELLSDFQVSIPEYGTVRADHPPLVLLLDISGSMSSYSRAVLYFCHALLQLRERLQVFLFGTRLTNATRALRERDPDVAIAALTDQVVDWSGGTRIGTTLAEFNRRCARRVLTGRATVLLVTDGLNHEAIDVLGTEMARLRRFAHRVIWLSPLLRFSGFSPKARGVQAILPHVDAHRPVHNLESLTAFGRDLALLARAPCMPLAAGTGAGAQHDGTDQNPYAAGLATTHMGRAERHGDSARLHSRLREHRAGRRERVSRRAERGGRSGEGAF
ncbi:MAG: Carbon monoxide oxidation accessory protein CoxD [uncultured Paraburkholderia sp.]|nr:MAG: Carbon monoxide oxidation accessory protein CoxD [uncultured Paraburkholderia sp.]CAH2909657.1 MAG: Carbon monoxide oxidation accessory protein CoxD [uncultured Paraburkholderia sp.]